MDETSVMMNRQTEFPRRLLLGAGGVALLSSCAQARAFGVTPPGSAEPLSAVDGSACAAMEPEYSVHAGPMTVALTFDDGPGPIYTAQVLAILRRYGVTATFFMIGENVEKYPDVLRQVLAEGHHLGNHTWSHPDLGKRSDTQVREEIERTNDIIARAGCTQPPGLFRAPYGYFTPASFAVCADLGLRPVSWSVDPRDWSNPGTDAIVDTVLCQARTGSIVLEHDGCLIDGPIVPGGPADRSQTVAALADYLPRLIHNGYRFTAVTPTA
jgi:peptidoglycan/xylan/chitin deacetylase (PgdA/CDA1 family)